MAQRQTAESAPATSPPARETRFESTLRNLPAAFSVQLRSARELLRTREAVHREAPLPTARPEIDALLGGGLERGVLTELVGGRGGGRFGIVLSALAAATAAGETVALIDLGDGLDPQAAETAGVALERLLPHLEGFGSAPPPRGGLRAGGEESTHRGAKKAPAAEHSHD